MPILYAGLIDYSRNRTAIGRYSYQDNLGGNTLGYADQIVEFEVAKGESEAKALQKFIANRPQDKAKWQKTLFAKFFSESKPNWEAFENRRPTPNGSFKPLELRF